MLNNPEDHGFNLFVGVFVSDALPSSSSSSGGGSGDGLAQQMECYECVQGTVKVDPYIAKQFKLATDPTSLHSTQQWRSSPSTTSRTQFVVDGENQCPIQSSGDSSPGGPPMYPSSLCAANRCVQMTILDKRGGQVGVKRACLEKFLTSYVMFVAPNSTSSRALTEAIVMSSQMSSSSASATHLTNSGGHYGSSSSSYSSSSGYNSRYSSSDPNIASDEPDRHSTRDDSTSIKDKIKDLSKLTLDEICNGNDKRVPCRNNYLDGEVCRIQCCSTPFCNSAPHSRLTNSQYHPLIKLSLILILTHSILQQFLFTGTAMTSFLCNPSKTEQTRSHTRTTSRRRKSEQQNTT
ncbi:uncharacterized protein LOC134845260 isoform X2 [Symsagittifera roscoffensis]|uniref:uncharacterized protein LOC134845260 isoform X2 n=1 Tax=Symsagittifera roscoffensis TaxID=84072 RepID=UPI00307BE35C